MVEGKNEFLLVWLFKVIKYLKFEQHGNLLTGIFDFQLQKAGIGVRSEENFQEV